MVSTDEAVCFKASLDNARLSFMPDAVVHPESEAAIESLLKLANQYRVPVTTRGAGSAATGATSPVRGGWVLDLSRQNKIRIDALSGFAYVQAGARIAAIQSAAEKRGWFYPPDPSSLKFSTIGGNVACNAGGMRGAKYGVTRDYVYALEGFLANGAQVRWAADLKKFTSGYNIRDLMIGSEGTLGVVTNVVLKLIPAVPDRWTALVAFKNEVDALQVVKAMARERIVAAILEFLDRQTVYCTEQFAGSPIFSEYPNCSLLLVELDGYAEQVNEDRERLFEIFKKKRFLDYREATDPKEMEALWQVRRRCSQAMFQLGDGKLNEDIVVPLKNQIALLRYTLQLKRETGLATPTFGHAGDGNFHVNIMYHSKDKGHVRKAQKAVKALMQKVIQLGGAITGEHGIGLAKSPFLRLQHSAAEIDAMRAIKKALDPNNILNPGKIFEPFEVWRHSPVNVQLPWDKC